MYNRRAVLAALTLLALVTAPGAGLVAPAQGAAPGTHIRGFSPDGLERERSDEATFMDIPSSAGALASAAVINENPHFAGTWGDRHLADYMRDQLRDFGFEASIETYTERLESPQKLTLALVRPRRVGFDLREAPDASDPDTSRAAMLPFNYGSADGNVTAPLVYVNRGLHSDYDALAKAHVDVRGALALIRYGAQFRGLLAERAQRHGAAGVIFYSDPKDDGYGRGAPYPDGPWRPAGSVQRGTLGENGLRIPTLPVNATIAQQLLASIAGTAAPRAWEGGLPVPYMLGRGPGIAHLSVKLKRSLGAIWNTIGVLPGRSPNRTVILGAHRDAWVYGVTDNGSGISTLLEVARGLGYLKRSGWVPKRTIVIAGWDAEELGEYGSRDYVRAHWQMLRRGGVAYLNADEDVAGPNFGVAAVAGLAGMVTAATQEVTDPVRDSLSVYDRWLSEQRTRRDNPHLNAPIVEAPAGGSDHESFLHETGMPVAELGFAGPFGVYHSMYDDLRYAERFADPGFALHRTAAQIFGLIAMRLADADNVPYEFTPYVAAMNAALNGLVTQTSAIALKPNFTPLRAAIARYARPASAADASIAGNGALGEDRMILAAQSLNRLFYGTLDDDPVRFPAIAQALAKNDAAAVAAAIGTTSAALDAASAQLTR